MQRADILLACLVKHFSGILENMGQRWGKTRRVPTEKAKNERLFMGIFLIFLLFNYLHAAYSQLNHTLIYLYIVLVSLFFFVRHPSVLCFTSADLLGTNIRFWYLKLLIFGKCVWYILDVKKIHPMRFQTLNHCLNKLGQELTYILTDYWFWANYIISGKYVCQVTWLYVYFIFYMTWNISCFIWHEMVM